MPNYDVDIPGKGTFTVNSPEALTDEQAYRAVMRQIRAETKPEEPVPQPQSGFKANVKAGIERLLGDKDAALAAFGVPGAAESAEAHRKRAAEIAYTPEITEKPWEYFKSVLGGSVPYMGLPLAAGVAATPLGVPAAMGLSGLVSAGQFTGSGLTRQLEEGTRPEDLSVGKAVAAAIPSAALDVVGFRYIPGIRKIFGSAGRQISNKEAAGIVEKYITPAFKAAGVEGGTETAQQVLERLQAGLSINDAEARKEYFDSFIGGAVLGGALAIPGSMLEGTEKPPAPKPTPTETPAAPTAELEPFAKQELLALPAPERAPQLGYTQPTRMLPAPPEKYDIYELMDHHETLKNSLDPLAEKIEAARAAGESGMARDLIAEYRDNEAKANALKTKIEELGGFTESREEIEGTQAKTLKDIDSKIAKLQNTINEMSRADVRDYDAVDKAEKQLEKLKAQRAVAEESFRKKQGMLRVKETPEGEQIPMFGAEEAQPKAGEVLKFKTEKGDEYTAAELEQAGQGPERPDQGVISAAAKKAVAQREQVLATRREELDSLMLDEYNDNLARTKAREKTLKENEKQPMDAYNRAHHEERLHQAMLQVRQLENEITALKEGAPTKAVKEKTEGQFNSDELYGNFNLLNTAINNNDQKTIDRVLEMRRKADLAAFNAQHSKLTPREEIYELLKNRIGGILRREKNYDTYEATINKERVELSVSEEAAKEILRLRNIVEAPRSRTVNGKKVPVRSLLQQLHDFWDDYNARETQLDALKKAKASPDAIAKKKQQVAKAKEKYQKKFEEVAGYRQQLDAELAKLYKKTGEFAPIEGTKGEPTIKTPRQKQEELEKLGKSARGISKQVKTAARAQAGKVKVSEAEVAKELGEKTEAYTAYAAQRLKELKSRADKYNKFLTGGKAKLAALKEKYTDAKEVARVEQELKTAIAVRNAVPDENPIEKEKADKKVNSLEAHLLNVKTPKNERYKNAEASFVKAANEKLDAFRAYETPVLADLQAKAVELGKSAPEFKAAVAKAQEKYSETVAEGKQEIKDMRTPQATRKVAKLGEMRTSSEESKSATQRRQEAFEATLSEAKGEAFDYQQRQEAIERTNKRREAKEGKGTAVGVALTKAAQEKIRKEAQAQEKKASDLQVISAFDTAAALKQLKEQGKFARGVEVQSPDLTSEQIKMLEADNLGGALRSIANDPKASELNRVVAARLAGMLDATNVVLKDKLFDLEGKEVLGEAISTQIQLSRNGGLSQEVLLHEATHAAVERVIQMPDSMLTKEQVIAKRELNAMFNAIKNDPSITSANAKSSLSEFAAEVFSNKNLQEQLRSKKWKGSSLWEGLKSVILRMLGVKIPENMLGAALKSVDLLMIPSSSKIGRVEKPANRKYSAKDIAALETGSNSMRVFAEQFGPEIKQKDRTVEDVERIASQYLTEMENKPKEFVAQAHPLKLDYKSAMTMSDGTLYDEDNLLHFVEADAATLAAVKADSMASMAAEEANAINKARNEALTSLALYLSNSLDYTLAEQALVAKAASKYGVISGKDGTLRVVNIAENNRHPIAVVGHESANAVIGKLREGKSLKDAFIEGMQKVADTNAKENRNKTGWQKFDQVTETDEEIAAARLSSVYTEEELNNAWGQTGYDYTDFQTENEAIQQLIDDGLLPDRSSRIAGKNKLQDAAVALNAGAAGTPWCTGASVGTARNHIKGGDFYIYYESGKPQVAIRMDGTNAIGEIRGNTPKQGLTDEQQTIAKQFLQGKNFDGTKSFIEETDRKAALIELISGKKELSVKDLMGMEKLVADGKIESRAVRRLLKFPQLNGYLSRDPSSKVANIFEKFIKKEIEKKYAQGYWLYSSIATVRNQEKDAVQEVSLFGKTYSLPISKIKATDNLTLSRNDKSIYDSLEYIKSLSLFNKDIIEFPNLVYVQKLDVYGDQTRALQAADGAVIDEIRPALEADVTVSILGKVKINSAVLLHNAGTLKLFAPDAEYVVETTPDFKSVVRGVSSTYQLFLSRMFREAGLKADELHNQLDQFGLPDPSEPLAKTVTRFYEQLKKLFGNRAVEEATAEVSGNVTVYNGVGRVTRRLLTAQGSVDAVLALGEKQYDAMAKLIEAKVTKNPFPTSVGKIISPNIVRPNEQTLTVTEERPRYAPKDVGVQEEKRGVFSFRSKEEPTDMASSFVGTSKSAKDTLMGNVLGLTGRVQFIDRFAALSEAFKKGKNEGVISSLEATQGEYYLRFGEQRSQYATQALTSGALHLKKLADGKGYIYESRPGANMMKVAEALSKSGIKNDTQAEAMLTAYVAGLRAEKVGWDKLNLKDPVTAKAEHAEVMAYLKQNPQAKEAFVEANKIYQEYNNGLIDFLVQTGAMSQKQAAELKALPYVPYYRIKGDVVELMVDKERPVRIGNIKDEPELQQLVGSNDQIMPIFTSAVQNTFILTNMALRNQMVKDSSFLLHKMGIASSIGKSTKTVVTNKKEIEEAAKAGKVIPEKTKEISAAPANPNIVRFKVNGEDHYAVIDSDDFGIPADLIVKGMEGIKTTLPFAVKAMGVPADILRKFVTRNPAYAIKQAIRDPLTAWMTTGTSGVPILNSFKELSSMVAGRSEEERKLMASGAISSNVFTGDQRDMDKALRDVMAGKQGWTKWMARADAFAMQGDAATRAVVYKDSLAKGMSEMEALLRTLESMNFSRRGLSPSMQAINVMVPFFNAQIQGLDVLYRAFKGDMPFNEQLEIRKKLFQRGLMLAAGTMAYAALMQDDEAYKNAKPEERLASWFVYIPGEKEPLKIPIPFELGYLFKALPEAVFNLGAEDKKSEDITKGMGKLLWQSVPIGLPQAIKPGVELYLNKSFYGGDIESQREIKTRLPTERYRETTTEIAKLLGSLTGDAGITPIGWDHLTRGYTGALGVALVSLANPLLNTEADVAKPAKKMHDTPFIGGLFQPVEGRGTLDAGYERMLEIQQAKGTYDSMLMEGKRDQAREFLEEYRNKITYASLSGSVQQQVGELAKLRRTIIAHPTMSEEQKTERVERIDNIRNKYLERFLSVTD